MSDSTRRVATFVLACVLGLPEARAAGEPQIHLGSKSPPTVDVTGLSAADLSAVGNLGLQGDAWSKLFAVYVVPAAGRQRGPAVLGSYRLEGGVLRFEPRFPLVPGVRYRAVLEPAQVPTRAARNEPAI